MVDHPNPFEPPHDMRGCAESVNRNGCSIVVSWIAYYLIAGLLLLLTAPVTSKSYPWSGIVPAFCVLMFGAYRLRRQGASLSTVFVFGCSTILLFLMRVLFVLRSTRWIQSDEPSIVGVVATSIAVCLFLGAAAATIARVTQRVASPSTSRQTDSPV